MSFTRQSILFISGLDKTVNENMLYQLFNEFPISYIKIAKDHNTRESFGYAFVGFKNHSKAEEALMKLNYQKLGKKTIRISWFNRESNNFRNNSDYNVFVKKINKNVTHKEFHDYFSKFGNIVSARLVEDEDGEVLGYGFVLYDNPEASALAIKESNGAEWKGKNIFAGQFIKNKPKKVPKFNNIYVKNIPKLWTRDQINSYFSRYGELGSTLIRDPDPTNLEKLPEGKRNQILSHKFAFICFKEFEAASRAVNQIPFLKIHDNEYNQELARLVELLNKNGVEERDLYRGAAYIIENVENYKNIFGDQNLLDESLEAFRKHLKENDDTYVVKDKDDRMDCCQALKRKDRIKKLNQILEKIKKQTKEKFRFCNLYVKNLPDNIDDEAITNLFSKFGEIRSAKTVKKELFSSYLGIKRSVKVFGFVCFYDAAHARDAKTTLHGSTIPGTNTKLFVDYHQNKQERQEYLKLKIISQSNKMFQKPKPGQEFPPMMKNMPMGPMRPFGQNVFGPHLLRKFPPQTGFMKAPMNMPMNQMPIQNMPQNMDVIVDKNVRRDFYGERLFTKISSNPNYSGLAE
jgi:polyadenylate-binding protein